MGQVTVELQGEVATVTLRNPQRRNAVDAPMLSALAEHFTALADGPRVIVLRGEGGAFCSGADLSGHPVFDLESSAERKPYLDAGYDVTRAMLAVPAPVIAAVDGACVGAGLTLALACDVVLAAPDARFGLDFVRMGVVPDMGSSYLLPRALGTARALDLALTARRLDAAEALRIGLVSRLADDVHAAAAELAQQMAAMPPLALAQAKRMVRELPDLPVEEALNREQEVVDALLATADCREAVGAFRERRTPTFQGR